jgi:hypothetical protein
MSSTIRPVTLDEIVGLGRYEAIRDEVRRRTIQLKKPRRVPVGDEITFVFENHDTIYFQIQEMVRAERITDLDALREEIAVYNALLPRPGELSATMLIEITDQEQIAPRLLSLLGIDEAVWLELEGQPRVRGDFEPGRSKEDRLSAVQYVRFALPPPVAATFRRLAVPARLVIDHPHYRAATSIAGETRASLAADLEAMADR